MDRGSHRNDIEKEFKLSCLGGIGAALFLFTIPVGGAEMKIFKIKNLNFFLKCKKGIVYHLGTLSGSSQASVFSLKTLP